MKKASLSPKHICLIASYWTILNFRTLAELNSSLWIDELGPIATLESSLIETIKHANKISQQGSIYYIFTWLFAKLIGTSELELRLPSAAAYLGTCFIIWKTVAKHYSTRAAHLSTLFFIASTPAHEYLLSARPYSLSLLFASGSVFYYLSWREQRTNSRIIIALLLAAISANIQYTMLVVPAILVMHSILEHSVTNKANISQLPIAIAIGGTLLGFDFFNFCRTWAERSQRSFAGTPKAVDMFSFALSFIPGLPPLLLIGFIIIWAMKIAKIPSMKTKSGSIDILLLLIYVVPISTIFVICQVSSARIFVPRYFIFSTVGFAIIIARAITLCIRPQLQIYFAALIATPIMFMPSILTEDWRQAVTMANYYYDNGATNETLLWSGFVESKNIDELDPLYFRHLISPVTYYGLKGKITLLPFARDNETDLKYFQKAMKRIRESKNATMVLLRNQNTPLLNEITSALPNFDHKKIGFYKSVELYLYTPKFDSHS